MSSYFVPSFLISWGLSLRWESGSLVTAACTLAGISVEECVFVSSSKKDPERWCLRLNSVRASCLGEDTRRTDLTTSSMAPAAGEI